MNNKHILLLLELIAILVILTKCTSSSSSSSSSVPLPTELPLGFKATANPSISSFQPLLNDSTANYSLGFLRVNKNQLTLSVIHVPSSVQLWTANTTRLLRWAHTTQLTFNGSLVLSDTHTGVFWSTHTNADRVWLSNTSNLQLQSRRDDDDNNITILWESFQFPSDTLVERQNFTSTMSLVSSNGFYSMRLGSNFFGLYANFRYPAPGPGQVYLKHGALEAKADIVEGQPLQLILQPEGYLGMYQNGSLPVDVESFNTFQHNLTGIRRVRIEPDGNLNGYYWTGSSWVLDYYAISDPCELPSSCGSYGLCKQGEECSCLDNRKVHGAGGCEPINSKSNVDFCEEEEYGSGFKIMRRSGVELPFKESMGYIKMDSLEKCEGACEGNCTCWGVVYSNSSGFCYIINYPLQSLLAVGDESKLGYFKVREGVGKQNGGKWLGLGLGLLFGAILVFAGVVGLGWYKWRSRGVKGYIEEDGGVGGGVGAYKDLNTASFRSIELSEK